MSDSWIGSIYAVSRDVVKRWRRSADLVGVRANQLAAEKARIAEEAAQVALEESKPRPKVPTTKKTFTAEEAALYLVKARELPTEKLHTVKAIIAQVVEYKHTGWRI